MTEFRFDLPNLAQFRYLIWLRFVTQFGCILLPNLAKTFALNTATTITAIVREKIFQPLRLPAFFAFLC